MDDTTYLVIGGFWILCGLAAGFLESQKGNDATDGFLIGVFLGPLGVILALISKKTEPVIWEQPAASDNPLLPPPPPAR